MVKLFPCLMLAFTFMALPAFALTSAEAIGESRRLAAEQKYDEALAVLEQAITQNPGDMELRMAMARVYAWRGDHEAAVVQLYPLGPVEDNADAQLLYADLAFYRGDLAEAEDGYRHILNRWPDYQDATAGLARVQAARQETNVASWQIDIGYEHSDLSRTSQSNWNQQFVQLGHRIDKATVLHGRVTRYHQFDSNDFEYQIGADHVFTPYATAYLQGLATYEVDFRPDYGLRGGGELRMINQNDALAASWLTLDLRYDSYRDTNIITANPGLRIDPWAGWSLRPRLITVRPESERVLYGHDIRLDDALTDNLRFMTGYANAPETVAGVTIDTASYFGGVAIDISDRNTLRLNYTYDDRENSYTRQVVNASLSHRF